MIRLNCVYRTAPLALCWLAVISTVNISNVRADWWEKPHDKWFFKDDWKAAPVNRYAPTISLESPAASGWVVVWGDQGVEGKVQGKVFMKHVDRGLVYDAALTALIKGEREIKLVFGPGRIVAEGEIVDDQGRRYPFASGCDWPVPAPAGTRLEPARNAYRPGEASGAFNSAHNGMLLQYDEEERGKTEISKTLGRIQRLREQKIFLLRRYRPAEEILSFDPDNLWRRAEHYAAQPMATAEKVLREQAIPAQKQSHFTDAIQLAKQAGVLLSAAELAVDAACALEEMERQIRHLEACIALITSQRSQPLTYDHDFETMHALLQAARREAGFDAWDNVNKRVEILRSLTAPVSEALTKQWGMPIGGLDEFPEDRFGWFNVLSLMGNNPQSWEFSLVPPSANWIDLSGSWWFRTDPPNQGEGRGWQNTDASLDGWRQLKVPGAWERQGVQDENEYAPWDCPYRLGDVRCEDKPYNGYAWYRRELFIPKAWTGKKVVLRLEKVSHWLRVFFNGQLICPGQKDGGAFAIPPEQLKTGAMNSIVVKVYNHDNFGGLMGGPVALSVDDMPPDLLTTPGPQSFSSEWTFRTPNGPARLVSYSPSMSPAVIMVSDQVTINLWGWGAKGYQTPTELLYQSSAGRQQIALGDEGQTIDGQILTASWLLLSGGSAPVDRVQLPTPKPVLLIMEKRPLAIQWAPNLLGFPELTLQFASPGARIIVLPWNGNEPVPEANVCEQWSRRLRAVPVACSELAKINSQTLQGDFHLKYHYFDLPDFTGQSAERGAPVPALLSYALKYNFPQIELPAVATTSLGSGYMPYRQLPHNETLTYQTPLIDKRKLLKGVGELFAKRRPELNARGGLTEQHMFNDWQAWGFDHCRYAFAWGADWDIPLQQPMGGSLNQDPQLWERMDYLVHQHTDRGLMAMLCYFFNEDSPQRDSKNLMRNSTRYWQMHPQTRTNTYELWRQLAARYADYPANLVAYDFLNEPAYMHQDDWNQIIKDLTHIVRSVDRRHLIVCEAGDGWSQSEWFLWVKPTGDTNTIYSFHHYGKHWGYDYDEYYPGYQSTPEKQMDVLLEAILFGIRYNVPMHCGEFGVSMISPGEDHLVWLDDYLALFERFGIGWNWWNWDGNGIYRTGLRAGSEISPNLKILRKWIDRKRLWGRE